MSNLAYQECIGISVLGPSLSGKTTLCDALAATLHISPPMYIKEVARNVMKTHHFTRDDVDSYEMRHAIMEAQLSAERRAITSAAEQTGTGVRLLVLSDRSAIDPCVYAAASTVPGAEVRSQKLLRHEGFRERLPFYRRSLFGKCRAHTTATKSAQGVPLAVVLESVPEWMEDDGVRSLEDPKKYGEVLQHTLDELGIAYITLGEPVEDLIERVRYVMEELGRTNSTNLGNNVTYTS